MKKKGIIILMTLFIIGLSSYVMITAMSLESDKKVEKFQSQYKEELEFLKKENISLDWESQIAKTNYNVSYLNKFTDFYEEMIGLGKEKGKGKESFLLSLLWNPILGQKKEKLNYYEIPIQGGSIFYDPLVLGVLKQGGKVEPSHYYCGTLTELLDNVSTTVLNGHTVGFNYKKELMDAFEKQDVHGVFLPKQLLQKHKEIKVETELVLASHLYLYVPEKLLPYRQVLSDMILLFEDIYKPSPNKNLLFVQKLWKIEEIRFLAVIMISMVGLFLFLTFLQKIKREKRFTRLEQKVEKSKPEEIVLYIDQKHEMMYCRNWGALFPAIKKKRLRGIKIKALCQMVGFDYAKYYAFIRKQQKDIFSNEYTIYQKGSAYRFLERGCMEGDYLISIIYKKEI